MTIDTVRAAIVVTAIATVVMSLATMVGLLSGGLATGATLAVMSVCLGLLVIQTFGAPHEPSHDA